MARPTTPGSAPKRRRQRSRRGPRRGRGRAARLRARASARGARGPRGPRRSSREPIADDRLRLAGAGEAGHPIARGAETGEHAAAVAVGGVGHRRHRIARDAARGAVFPDPDQAVRVAQGQRPQQHGVHDAEDRGVGADGDGERGHRDRGEPGPPRATGARRASGPGCRLSIYSARSALTGATRVARQAGTALAAREIVTRKAAAAA